jgi:hypothetical protein
MTAAQQEWITRTKERQKRRRRREEEVSRIQEGLYNF